MLSIRNLAIFAIAALVLAAPGKAKAGYTVTITSPANNDSVTPDQDGYFTVSGTASWGLFDTTPTHCKITLKDSSGLAQTADDTQTQLTFSGRTLTFTNLKIKSTSFGAHTITAQLEELGPGGAGDLGAASPVINITIPGP